MRNSAWTGVVAAGVGLACLMASVSADARSPLPYFRGIDTIALYCGSPADDAVRDDLCAVAKRVLDPLVGASVEIGATGFRNPGALTVLVNGHRIDGPDGPVLAVTADLLRKDRVDRRLVRPAPILLPAGEGVTTSLRLENSLKALFTEMVIVPWRTATPR